MAIYVLKEAKIYLDGYDISGDANKISLSTKAEERDITTFGQSAKKRICGLMESEIKVSGYYQANAVSGAYMIDDIISSKLAVADQVISVFPQTGAVGEVGFGMKAMIMDIARGGSAGEVMPFDMSAMSNNLLVKGTMMESGVKNATGNGTGRQLGAILATQKVYAGVHVLAASGTNPTLTVKIQSDDNASFTSATDQITMTQMTTVGAQWATPLSGAIADTYWRFYFAVGGTGGPSFTVRAWIGIQ